MFRRRTEHAHRPIVIDDDGLRLVELSATLKRPELVSRHGERQPGIP